MDTNSQGRGLDKELSRQEAVAESKSLPEKETGVEAPKGVNAPIEEKAVGVSARLTAIEPGTAPFYAPATQLEKEIESVLEEGLAGLYQELSEPEKIIFKHKGEETASKIRILLGEATVRVQEIFRLIMEWLKILPGVSKFFIEREAKIKTDKLLKFR